METKQFQSAAQVSLHTYNKKILLKNMEFILILVVCLCLMLPSSVLSVDVTSACYVNSGIGELKNSRVKYETIYVERVDLAAMQSGRMEQVTELVPDTEQRLDVPLDVQNTGNELCTFNGYC